MMILIDLNEAIELNIDWLNPGTHSFLIQVNDGYGKISADEVIITVESDNSERNDENEPMFTSTDLNIIIGGIIIAGAITSLVIIIYIKLRNQQKEFQSRLSQRENEFNNQDLKNQRAPKK